MFLRPMLCFLICCPVLSAQTTQDAEPVEPWLARVPALRVGDRQPFQFRADMDAMAEQITAHVSWAPPDRRCVILCDRVDGLPLMIAVDGQVWFYDLISGQILRIRAEPQLLTKARDDRLHTSWGMRADFPSPESRVTIDVDLGAVLARLAQRAPNGLTIDEKQRHARFQTRIGNTAVEAALEMDDTDPMMPESFVLEMKNEAKKVRMRFDSFARRDERPSWHQPVDETTLPRELPVVAVADVDELPADTQKQMTKFRKLLNGGGAFILRPALRDPNLQRAIEANSPIKLDFATIRANDRKMRDAWRKALHEQGFDLPKLAPADDAEE